jgi:hypothetical protein
MSGVGLMETRRGIEPVGSPLPDKAAKSSVVSDIPKAWVWYWGGTA